MDRKEEAPSGGPADAIAERSAPLAATFMDTDVAATLAKGKTKLPKEPDLSAWVGDEPTTKAALHPHQPWPRAPPRHPLWAPWWTSYKWMNFLKFYSTD